MAIAVIVIIVIIVIVIVIVIIVVSSLGVAQRAGLGARVHVRGLGVLRPTRSEPQTPT